MDTQEPSQLHTLIKNKALDFLTRREYAAVELSERLAMRFKEHQNIIDAVIEDLQNQGLQSDHRFSEVLIRHRAQGGYGRARIAHELMSRGVDSSIIEMALEEAEIDFDAIALGQYKKHFKNKPIENVTTKQKHIAYLKGRGFDFSQIQRVLKVSLEE